MLKQWIKRPGKPAASPVQHEVAQRLLERLDGLKFEPASVLDMGCGEGIQVVELARRFPDATVTGLDRSLRRLKQARSRQGRWRKSFELIGGDGHQLPFAQGSVDLLFSSLVLPFCTSLPDVLNGFRRALKPGGLLLFSTLGPDSLAELRAGLTDHDRQRYPQVLTDVQTVGNALMRSGFVEPVLDTDWFTLNYRKSTDLIKELRVIDPEIWLGGGRDALAGFRRRRSSGGLVPVAWEVVYASAWAPEDGAPIRDYDGGEVASISVENIGRRKR